MPKLDLQHLPPIGSPLSGVAPAAADNTADHGDFAQVWRWKLTRPSNTGLRITESVASTATGTPPLVQIDTLANSTAIPLLVKSQGTEVFRVAAAGATATQMLFGVSYTGASPIISFQGDQDTGIDNPSSNKLSFVVGGGAAAQVDVNANLTLGGTTAPAASLGRGISLLNGTVPSADPTTAGCFVHSSTLGLVYRSSVSSEGSGQNNIIHNRTSNIVGAGTNYTLTTSWARIDFGTTDADLTLPTAGTYLLIAQVQYTPDASGASDSARFMLLNATDTLDIGTPRYGKGVASVPCTVVIIETVTVTAASKLIRIQAVNDTANRGVITSTGTTLHYVRLS